MSDLYVAGLPGIRAPRTASYRKILNGGWFTFLPGGGIIDGSKSRDPGNTSDIDKLRAGLLMGRISSSGKWAPSVYGVTTGSVTSVAVSVSMAAAVITEIGRRVGSTTAGSFKITGPPTTNGTSRSLTATYTALSGTTATIGALGVNEVQTMTFGSAATGGTLRLRVPKASGEMVLTDAITWDTTDATFLSNINTALDAATGVTGGIVATGATPDTILVFTFSGTGYAGLPQPTEMISAETLPTSVTTVNVVRTTTGVDGRFVSGAFVQPADGSETALSFVPDGFPLKVTDVDGTSIDTEFPQIPVAGEIESSQLLPWPSDTGLQAQIVAWLNAAAGGKFVFDHPYVG